MADATACARVLVEELLTRGVREAVLAPGSRSAPLAYEFYEADRIGLLRLHVRVDERTAGFLALGLAKASGTPVPVLTTSGTAAANLHPAVLEAWHAHVPLIAVTASRPRRLVHTGSNQTTDQEDLFGRHVVAASTIADERRDVPGWRFEVARLLAAAAGERTRRPGPVQLNVEFSEPLLPVPVEGSLTGPDLQIAASAGPGEPVRLPAGPQTVLVAGDAPPGYGRGWAERAAAAGLPLVAEPSSNARSGPAAVATGRLLLTTALAEEIERVVVVGHPTLSRPVSRLLARPDVDLVVVSPYADWPDPGRSASRVVDDVVLEGLGDPAWLARWRRADAALAERLAALLDGLAYLSGPAVAATLWTALGPTDTLVAGSSNPVRDLDLAPLTPDPPEVWANRGLAGIDGTVSTAAGIGLVAERPTHALLGDLTTLHDLTGLVVGRAEPRPDLRIVVANDDGGSIFATLEQGEPAHAGAFERIFGTPHGVAFQALCAGLGVRYQRVATVAELTRLLAEPPVGIEVVEAVVDRRRRRTLQRSISALAASV